MIKAITLTGVLFVHLIAAAQSTTVYRCGTSAGVVVSQFPCGSDAAVSKRTLSGYSAPSSPYSYTDKHSSSGRVVSGKVLSEEGVPLQDLQNESAPKPFKQSTRSPS